jgi:hypothetical protein
MTVIGKLMAFALFVVGMGLLVWAVGVYVQRPPYHDPLPEGGGPPVVNPTTFAEFKAETEVLGRAAAVATDTWGANLKDLETREAFRRSRLKAYAQRREWAKNGNPKDLAEPGNPDSGKAFYGPVVDPALKLYDLTVDATGKPKGEAVLGGDNLPLRGTQKLSSNIETDIKRMDEIAKEVHQQRGLFDEKSKTVIDTEKKLLATNVIRDSIQAEWFFLSSFEVNVYETRETVLRRERQLRNRLKTLGVYDP